MSGGPILPRAVFVNRYYWPEEPATAQLLVDLAEGLAARGRRIMVITSHDGMPETPLQEVRRGVDIIRVRATRWGRRRMAAKAIDYLTFALAARRVLRRKVQAGDWLIAMTDPPVLAQIAATTARRAGARLAHWVQDVHPEVGLALSGSRALAAVSSPWRRWRDAAWRQADACVAISRDMAGLVGEHGVAPERIRTIPNWAPGGETLAPVPADKNSLRHEWGLDGKFVVAYSGNLGRVHALEPVLAAAARLRGEPDLVFLFIGDGPQRQTLEAQARTQGLVNVRFLPPQPRARLAESLSAGDVHLVTLRAGCERCVFPSKLYGILAVARPIIYVGPLRCELAVAVRNSGAGLVVDAREPQTLADCLRQLRDDAGRRTTMAQAAAGWARTTGGLPGALASWEEILAGK
jgi:glycosyltransferase involved in cell wall biosynthesis